MNGSSKGTEGVINLGTVITEHQDITHKLKRVNRSLYDQVKEILDINLDAVFVRMKILLPYSGCLELSRLFHLKIT